MTNSTNKNEHWLFGPISKQKGRVVQLVLASVIINIFALISAFYILTVYDRVIPNETTDSLIYLTAGMIGVIIFDFLMKIVRGLLTDTAGIEVDEEVAESFFEHVRRNEKLIGQQPTGSITTTIKEFDTLKDVMASATLLAFADLPFIFIFLLVLYLIGGPIAAVPAVIVIFVIIVGLGIQPIIKKMSSSALEDGKSKQSVLVEMISGLETLKSLNGISLFKDRWSKSVKEQGKVLLKARFWNQLLTNIAQSGQQASQVGIIVYGVLLIMNADLTMGALIACVILSGRTLAPLGQITNLLGRLNQARVAYLSLEELFSKTSKEELAINFIRHKDIKNTVTAKNLEITYPNSKTPSISEANFQIKENEKIAILGRIGSGKTTLLRGISGLIEPSSGTLEIGGVDINHLHPDDLRATISICLQSPLLFSGTIKENILLGNPLATDEDIIKYSELTGVDLIANNLPNGYSTNLNERGEKLSGGQRQAITIARTLISEPKIILMDEPTSSMDAQTEAKIIDSLKSISKNKTLILSTHRGQLLDIADRVIIVDSGKIVADGPKTEIFKNHPKAGA